MAQRSREADRYSGSTIPIAEWALQQQQAVLKGDVDNQESADSIADTIPIAEWKEEHAEIRLGGSELQQAGHSIMAIINHGGEEPRGKTGGKNKRADCTITNGFPVHSDEYPDVTKAP